MFRIKGYGTSGKGEGRAFLHRRNPSECKRQRSQGTDFDRTAREKERFFTARAAVLDQLNALFEAAEGEVKRIIDAQRVMLDDPFLESLVVHGILDEGLSADEALSKAAVEIYAMFDNVDDEYIACRVDDVRDVIGRLSTRLAGERPNELSDIPDGSVLVADELLPSDTILLNFNHIRAIVTERGSRTSHLCIIARGRGVPVVVGAKGILSVAAPGDQLLVDADSGEVVISPDMADIAAFRELSEGAGPTASRDVSEQAYLPELPEGIHLLANAGSLEEVILAVQEGAEGIGLFRTEFMYMTSDGWPDEDILFESYKKAALALEGKPLTIRTLDVGGDKILPYASIEQEDNPFLGLRGIRYFGSRCNRASLITQLRAILRASAFGNVRVMLPMVSRLDELLDGRDMLDYCMGMLRDEGTAFDKDIKMGIMVETPAAVLRADTLALHCDFFSIGTNDLTQYIMAADRGNPGVAYLCNAQDEAVLEAVRMTARAAEQASIGVSVCGEAASDPATIPLLLDCGVRSFSVAASLLSHVRSILACRTTPES